MKKVSVIHTALTIFTAGNMNALSAPSVSEIVFTKMGSAPATGPQTKPAVRSLDAATNTEVLKKLPGKRTPPTITLKHGKTI